MHGHYLDAMGPFLKYFPDAAGSVINKLFELLTSLTHIVKVSFCYIFSVLEFIHAHNSQLFTVPIFKMYMRFLIACFLGRIQQLVLQELQDCRFVHPLYE